MSWTDAASLDQFDLFSSRRADETAPAAVPVTAVHDDLPDAGARQRIREDLDTSMLVEAGAGAGKTTEMVRRMVALVASGRAIPEHIAAVTFTRKAASELRERFQTALEGGLRHARATEDVAVAERLDRALRDIDRAFLGTIHAFCARLLRERPLEAGLDPDFREMLGGEERRARRAFWNAHVERMTSEGDAALRQLGESGLHQRQVYDLYVELTSQPDVEFPAEAIPRPDVRALRATVESLMDEAERIEGHGARDDLRRTLGMLRYHRFVAGWDDDARFLEVIAPLRRDRFRTSAAAWLDADGARALRKRFEDLYAAEGTITVVWREWLEYRYPAAIAFAQSAAHAYAADRVRMGLLNFQDLLMHAAALLRGSAGARADLGERYRYLLVDEFQDTDPVQAEVLFLLSSAPPAHTETGAWKDAVPRGGALFVVGDPRQSIYRFRRADTTLYAQVKARFEQWGAVVHLVTNFRSGHFIERFVNDNFETRFPAESSAEQAQFAPLYARPRDNAHAAQGVYWYDAGAAEGTMDQLADAEAARLAGWIRDRIASGDRTPGEFLVLTRNTKRLGAYATALENAGVPVQVSGAGILEKEELRELRLLLLALSDPSDPALVVGVLTGLLHGLDYEQLLTHIEQNADTSALSFTRSWDDAPDSDVVHALRTLRRYWMWARDNPADVAVARIVDDTGLLQYAAAGRLGRTRVGALLYALDAIRKRAAEGDPSMAGAVAALDAALEENESEAPLEPGRTDVVRVMNLHKAKGLEARVVVLAHPFEMPVRPPHVRIERQPDGGVHGFMQVTERGARGRVIPIAQPRNWDGHAGIEQRFQDAERERILYVAATRAAEEIVVGTMAKEGKPSPWSAFHGWLRDHGTRLVMLNEPAAPRARPTVPAETVLAAAAAAHGRRAAMRVPSYRAAAVTARKAALSLDTAEVTAQADATESADAPVNAAVTATAVVTANAAVTANADATAKAASPYRVDGTGWGSVVHDALEYLARGGPEENLAVVCRGLLIAAERPLDDIGAPQELEELLRFLAVVTGSEVWRRAQQAEVRLVETPFGIGMTDADYTAIGGAAAAPVEIIDGRIDLAFRIGGSWTIVDYKSDAAGSKIPKDLLDRYRTQLRLYAEALRRITREPVDECVLLFAADGEVVA